MNAVDKVKSICKERKIPISKLEKDLGFSNGYIGQLRKGTFPNDRLFKIASYLDVSVSELTEYDQKEKTPALAGAEDTKITDETLKFALWGDTSNIDDADLEDVRRYAAFIAERKKGNK